MIPGNSTPKPEIVEKQFITKLSPNNAQAIMKYAHTPTTAPTIIQSLSLLFKAIATEIPNRTQRHKHLKYILIFF